ncbi:MAG: glucosamine-6-phosphate deaminase [Thermoanaerobaculia bacterium]
MKWVKAVDAADLSLRAAAILLDIVEAKPDAALGLPTGRTPEGLYAAVVSECRARYRRFRDVSTFNLDEYVGIPPSHPGSYRTYMDHHLFRHVDIDPVNIHIPDGLAQRIRMDLPGVDFESALVLECARYESAIEVRGIDVMFLGVGRNGHIGFNEPGAPFDSRTRVVELAESTRVANAVYFPDRVVPERAITMGIATILSARKIVVLASGASKREVMARLRSGAVDAELPASALHSHRDVTVIADAAAAD